MIRSLATFGVCLRARTPAIGLTVALSALFAVQPAIAATSPVASAPTASAAAAPRPGPQPPEIAARSYLLVDLTTGQTLAEHAADAPADPASLTKLMTAYLTFQAIRDKKLTLEQTLPVSVRAWSERKGGGSLMFIEPRNTPTVAELLRGMIVQSGNDASVVLAEGVGGTLDHFIEMMNQQAAAWGLANTAFKNATGLTEPGHHSTARDLSVIAGHIIRDHPEFYGLYSIRKYHYPGSPPSNENNRNVLLLRDPTVDGMKTGYTEAAGYCLIASARREFPNLSTPRRLLSVVLGAGSMEGRANESQKLLNWGYQAFDAVRLFDAGKPMATVPVWKGSSSTAQLGSLDAVVIDVPKGEGAQLQTRIERTDPLVAPLAKGQRVGTLNVSAAGGTPIAIVPVQVLEPVDAAGMLGRAWDSLRLWIK